MAVEIVRTLVGSVGLVAAVPMTTAGAAFVVTLGSGGPPSAVGPPEDVLEAAQLAPGEPDRW